MRDLWEKTQAKPKELRPHQVKALDMVRSSAGKGNRRIVCQMPTGAGKTVTAAKLILSALGKGKSAIFTAPAINLIDQTVTAFEAEGISHIGVMQASHPRTDWRAPVQVASVQTLARRDIPDAALVIVDECFVAGTLVDMADGSRLPIEAVNVGDAVITAIGPRPVQATSERLSAETYAVEFDDGERIECTGNHPFFTQHGWRKASSLGDGSCVVGVQAMPGLWGGVWPRVSERESDGREGVEGAANLLEILREEIGQPVKAPGSCGKGIFDPSAYWAQADAAWRQRVGDDCASGGFAGGAGGWLETGACRERLEGDASVRSAESLQDRRGKHGIDDSDRGGRRQPLPNGEARTGQAQGHLSGWRRVARVSRVKRDGAVAVFNLQVGGHPSYFAGGCLVHNCHIRSEVVDRLMTERPDVFFVGLSATPWAQGMGLLWQDLVIPVTIGELIGQGFLSQFTAYAPDVPDLSNVKVKAGEYVESALEAVMGQAHIMGNVVTTWLEHGGNRPTLCFAVNRAHARALADEFARHGVATGYVDAMTDIAERQYINARFRDGDIRVICSVRTMTTGVDLPVSCIIDAAPTRSEMLHVQKIGRGLRVNPGTEDCLILDHAGNSLRLGLVTDIYHGTLDKRKPGEKAEDAPKAEKLPKPCSACGTLHTGKTCPTCGHERKPVSGVEMADGELVELTPRKSRETMAEKQAFWSMALWVDRERDKGGKLAKALYKGKFGVWPKGLHDTPQPPDPAFMNYEKSRRIAYAKRMAKERGVAA